ncbi:hypothetical protein F5148DRAFT_421615 [Russula earlei]|uniref:Uncharacterized protein n=1 Tax=Russula earlei TaxID=71964 RepID=A0ACC0UHA0_9AGAM|nr:hypothetical protein F5148DRAFT_421615 [Russula earlei]
MSASDKTPRPLADNFSAIFRAASIEYCKTTGSSLDTHPLATQLEFCHSPEDISNLLRTQAQAFAKFRQGDEKLMTWLDPTVHILYTFSAALGDVLALPFSPAKTVFTSICVLLGAVRDEAASHETLIHIFERIHFFLQRLNSYARLPLTNDMTELLGKIIAQLLSVLALSTKLIMKGRFRNFLKKLAGGQEIEDALVKLDSLTREENLRVAVRTLEITHHVEYVVQGVDNHVRETKVIAKVVDENVKATKELLHDVDGDVKDTKSLTQDIGENVRTIDHDVKATKDVTHELKQNQLRH